MTYIVVSVGAIRALSGGPGGSAGGVRELRSVIVVGTALLRFTSVESGSAPTFTDHRSTPQVGLWIVSVIGAVATRPWPSVIVATMLLAPVDMNGPIVAVTENTLSPAVWSPFVPSSTNATDDGPPMLVRSAVTVMLVLGGVLAGVTLTVSNVLLAGSNDCGEAMPSPKGCVGSPPQELTGEELFRGIGPFITKSLELLSVSRQPLPFRIAAVVFDSGPTGAVSKQFALP